MNRLAIFGLAATFTVGNLVLSSMVVNPPVELQPVTPGVAQTGHMNVSGTVTSGVIRTGTVFGNSTALSGTASGGDFRSASTAGRGIFAFAGATSGLTYGGFFQNASSTGRAVYGLATATNSTNFGGYFQSAGASGRGVLGVASSSSGITYGVYGTATSPLGFGVYSEGNLHATGTISGESIQVTGNISAGSVTISPAQREYVVGAFDFVNALSTITDLDSPNLVNGAAAKSFYAPVHLPDGATVTSVSSFITDNDTVQNATVYLIRRYGDTGIPGHTMAQFSSGGESPYVTDDTIQYPTVDNVAFVYFVKVTIPGNATPNKFRMASVHVAYTITSVP